jgi:hypothetical protein
MVKISSVLNISVQLAVVGSSFSWAMHFFNNLCSSVFLQIRIQSTGCKIIQKTHWLENSTTLWVYIKSGCYKFYCMDIWIWPMDSLCCCGVFCVTASRTLVCCVCEPVLCVSLALYQSVSCTNMCSGVRSGVCGSWISNPCCWNVCM